MVTWCIALLTKKAWSDKLFTVAVKFRNFLIMWPVWSETNELEMKLSVINLQWLWNISGITHLLRRMVAARVRSLITFWCLMAQMNLDMCQCNLNSNSTKRERSSKLLTQTSHKRITTIRLKILWLHQELWAEMMPDRFKQISALSPIKLLKSHKTQLFLKASRQSQKLKEVSLLTSRLSSRLKCPSLKTNPWTKVLKNKRTIFLGSHLTKRKKRRRRSQLFRRRDTSRQSLKNRRKNRSRKSREQPKLVKMISSEENKNKAINNWIVIAKAELTN